MITFLLGMACRNDPVEPQSTCDSAVVGGAELWPGEPPPALFERWTAPVTFAAVVGDLAPVDVTVALEPDAADLEVTAYTGCPFPSYTPGDLLPADGYTRLVAQGTLSITTSDGSLDGVWPAAFTFTPHTLAWATVSDARRPRVAALDAGESLSVSYVPGFTSLLVFASRDEDSRTLLDVTVADRR